MGKKNATTQAVNEDKEINHTRANKPHFFNHKPKKTHQPTQAREIRAQETNSLLTEILSELKTKNKLKLEEQNARKEKEERKAKADEEEKARDEARFEEVRYSMYI
ncbi:coiled-coil protein [Legionella drozanskii LLAP-1]|uniref:Coiled-coil protein n=2 Tax=Legionellaceae TaxID=444 RepID=A0A0W0TAH9_9GAMM|nr:coiled-coil protein [Legionella drozanskii LLAP-1]PJE12290.1 MAG: hypothetical protein CK430_07795 [Legionella sp.]